MRWMTILGVLAVLAACDSSTMDTDAGSTSTDAGGSTDAGSTPTDAGDSADAGGSADAGPMIMDAGGDAGELSADAGGMSLPDAGSDAGAMMSTDSGALLRTGAGGCTADDQCEKSVCWDFSDYDRFCGGSVCSAFCVDDADCQAEAASAGAPSPSGATCGSDNRCNLMGAGLGGPYFCA